MQIKCAIFDFDGTLFDSMHVWDNAAERYLRSVGKEPEPSVGEEVKAMSLAQSAYYLKRVYALPFSAEEIIAGINRIVEHFYIHEVLPKPGVMGLLNRMKKMGISLCIATATERYQIQAALNRCEMSHCFDAIFTCGEVGFGKDEPVIFRKAMEHFGADRSNTVIFEDALHAIQTAKSDGFTVVGVMDGSEKRQDEIRGLSDCYIRDFYPAEEFWKFMKAGE